MTTEETHTNPRNGSINAALTTGIIGSAGVAAGLLGGNGLFGGLFGGRPQNCVTKEEFDLNNKIMEKDGEIALLKADKYTNVKLLEVYNDINDKVEKLNDKINCNKSVQDNFNMNQAVINATQSGTINCMQGQINQLFGLTKLGIPNSVLTPGVGSVQVAPQYAVSILSA